MNGKDLLLGLGNISHKYYDEAENETFVPQTTVRRLRKPLLVAALIALTLLLVGCAVVYALRLQDMSIGKETYIQHFDEEGKSIEPTEKTRDIITIYGHSGDPIQLALKEWFAFLETYDPDGELMDNNPDHPEIPNNYEHIYSCYTQNMIDKVDEIAAKHGLKILENRLPFQQWQSDIFFEETGIGTFLLLDCGAEITHVAGMLYEPYNFSVEFELATDRLGSKLWGSMDYAHKDYFPRAHPGGMDLSQYEQWDYTAPDGTPLLMALSNQGRAYIIAEPENAMLILHFDGNFSTSHYPEADEIITKEELEAVADLFNYSIAPKKVDRAAVERRLAETQAQWEADQTYLPPTWSSFTDVLTSKYLKPNEAAQYTFFDLTGDGVEELLLDYSGDGAIDEWFAIQDGEVQFYWGNESYLCEGRVLERYLPDPELEDYAHHYYLKADSETAWMDFDQETDGGWLEVLLLTDGQWSHGPELFSPEIKEITPEEAQAVMDKYPRIELDWKPVMDYPVSRTQTFRDILEIKDVRVSHEELLEIYREYLTEREHNYSHYRILDINNDGVEDLLLKGENDSLLGRTDYYWIALTYRYGYMEGILNDFYLCENGVLECVETRRRITAEENGILEIDGHKYMRYNDFDGEVLDFIAYNKATASWWGDWWDEKPITAEEANAILAKYPRIDQGMRPVAELVE